MRRLVPAQCKHGKWLTAVCPFCAKRTRVGDQCEKCRAVLPLLDDHDHWVVYDTPSGRIAPKQLEELLDDPLMPRYQDYCRLLSGSKSVKPVDFVTWKSRLK